ncbi:MAG: hypothetical protein A4S09_16050 [Proteobacteria bacterium SG_bin7]|nr:MAG: hypothetical protein A4S09_16050 [Proteobacteria bacterium SG_bin7]
MKFEYQLIPFSPNKTFNVWSALKVLDHEIDVTFTVTGELSKLYIPDGKSNPQRLDNLWKHTCFETFIKQSSQRNYIEINASPSGDWALYSFTDYHQGMANVSEVNDFKVSSSFDKKKESLKCWYTINLKPFLLPENNLDIGLSCILETNKGELSYWAINHKNEKPDFHLASNFIHI